MTKQSTPKPPLTSVKRGFTGGDTPAAEIFQKCVRCGFCLPSCPTYLETLSETSSPRGRIHLIEAVSTGQLDLTDSGFVKQMYQCLDCRACEAVCPSGVEYGKLVETARTQIEQAIPGSLFKRAIRRLIFHHLFGNMQLFRLLCRLLSLYQHSGLRWLMRKSGLLHLLRLAEIEALLPSFPKSFLTCNDEQYPAIQPSVTPDLPLPTPTTSHNKEKKTQNRVGTGLAPVRKRASGTDSRTEASPVPTRFSLIEPDSVALFAGCIMSTAFADTDRATIGLLNLAGYSVITPKYQGCCGALTVHVGDMNEARIMARRNIEAFEQSGAAAYIIVNAAGCGAALKEYAYLMRHDPLYAERAAHFSAQVRDITEFLVNHPLPTPSHPLHLKVTYQEPCHLVHAQRISQAPRALLRNIPGLELIEMLESSLCCGSAGIYNITQPAMSQRLQQRKIQHIQQSGADIVVTANPGCYLQLQSGLQRAGSKMRVMHIVDLLDMAYRPSSHYPDMEAPPQTSQPP